MKSGSLTKVHSRSVDPQKHCRNYLINRSNLKFPTPRRSSLQHSSFDILYISAVGSKNKKLAILSVVWHTVHMYYVVFYAYV